MMKQSMRKIGKEKIPLNERTRKGFCCKKLSEFPIVCERIWPITGKFDGDVFNGMIDQHRNVRPVMMAGCSKRFFTEIFAIPGKGTSALVPGIRNRPRFVLCHGSRSLCSAACRSRKSPVSMSKATPPHAQRTSLVDMRKMPKQSLTAAGPHFDRHDSVVLANAASAPDAAAAAAAAAPPAVSTVTPAEPPPPPIIDVEPINLALPPVIVPVTNTTTSADAPLQSLLGSAAGLGLHAASTMFIVGDGSVDDNVSALEQQQQQQQQQQDSMICAIAARAAQSRVASSPFSPSSRAPSLQTRPPCRLSGASTTFTSCTSGSPSSGFVSAATFRTRCSPFRPL